MPGLPGLAAPGEAAPLAAPAPAAPPAAPPPPAAWANMTPLAAAIAIMSVKTVRFVLIAVTPWRIGEPLRLISHPSVQCSHGSRSLLVMVDSIIRSANSSDGSVASRTCVFHNEAQ
jgi:hypothetical protein